MSNDLDQSVEIAFKRRSNVVKANHYEELIQAHERSIANLEKTLKLVDEDSDSWKEYMDLNARYKESLVRLRNHYLSEAAKEDKVDRFHTVSLWLMAIGLVATFVGQAVYSHVKAAEQQEFQITK